MGTSIIKDFLFISVFLLFVAGIMFIKISESRISLIKTFVVSIWTGISIGAVFAFIMNCTHIPIGLVSMSAVYGICAVFVWIYLLKYKQMQKLEFRGRELACVIFCILLWGYVFIKSFGFELYIAYANVDAGAHFRMASEILNSHRLTVFMYFAPLYNGLIMEMFQPFLEKEAIYKVFILADASLNLMNLLMFWMLASQFIKSRFSNISIYVILILYFLGWPVWSWIAGGFVYFGAGVTIYIYGIYQLARYQKCCNRGMKIYHMLLVLMTVFCLIKCYLLFVPLFISTIVVYILYTMRTVLTKKTVLCVMVSAGCVALLAFALIYWGYFDGDADYIFSALKTDGGIFEELYKDFMFMLPINAYLCWVKLKIKRVDLFFIALVTHAVITVIALITHAAGVISAYYYFKLYYLGWALQLIGVVQAVEYLWKKKRQAVYFAILPIAGVALLELTGLNQKITVNRVGNDELFPVITDSIKVIKNLNASKETNKEKTDHVMTVSRWINSQLGDDKAPLITNQWNPIITWYTAMSNNEFFKVDEVEETEVLENLVLQFSTLEYGYFTMMRDTEIFIEQEPFLKQFEVLYDDGVYVVYSNTLKE